MSAPTRDPRQFSSLMVFSDPIEAMEYLSR